MKLKCLVVDDEPIARKILKEYISDIDFLEHTAETDTALKAGAFLEMEKIDLIFLDINMPRLTGLELLRTAKFLPMVIMTTAYAEYALDGYEFDVLDYLIKPFAFERFLKSCIKAKEYQQMKDAAAQDRGVENPYFFVKCNGRIEKVFHDELLYIEAAMNYVTLHTSSGKMIVYLTMKGMMEALPPNVFLKVHKSFIVNSAKIRSIEGNILHIGNAGIPVGQGNLDEVMRSILKDRMIRRDQ